MLKRWLSVILCLLPLACSGPAAPPPVVHVARTSGDRSAEPADPPPPPVEQAPTTDEILEGTHWPPAQLESGRAWVGCAYDYQAEGDGTEITSLDFFPMADLMGDCRDADVVRLRYEGRINAGFTALVQRVAAMADRMGIDERILDLDSAGGYVEEAIRAGDSIGAGGWSIWVREDAVCHSACVLVLAAGDTRSIEGKVGIHRLMREESKATTRIELAEELESVTTEVRDYLRRNGVAATLADQMMIVPNRNLRVLDADELARFGLSGTNAAQDDLNRIVAMRKCGTEFVHRRDAFVRAFDAQCMEPGEAFEDKTACGLALRERFGFPDERCPDESPLADLVDDRTPPPAG